MKYLPTRVRSAVAHSISATTAIALTLLIVYFGAEGLQPNVHQQLQEAVSQIMAAEELAAIYGPSKKEYRCINAHLDQIKQEKTLDALLNAFRSCDSSFADTFGPLKTLSEGLRFGAFLALVSSRVAPYGPSKVDISNQEPSVIVHIVLGATSLSCSQQMALVANALKLAFPNIEVNQVGVVSNSINHAMVFASDSTGALLLDPTTSVIVAAPLQDVLRGKPVDIYSMIDYYEENDELLEQFRRKLRGALRNGAIRQEDVIYNNRL